MKNDYKEINFVDKDIMLTGCSGRRPSMTGGNNNSNMTEGNKDTMPLDTREGHEYDNLESFSCHSRAQTRESRNKDTMSLDIREGAEYDNMEFSSLSPSGLTRGSRNKDTDSINKDINSNWIFGSSPNMTKGSNNLKMPEGNNNSEETKGNNDICISIPKKNPLW